MKRQFLTLASVALAASVSAQVSVQDRSIRVVEVSPKTVHFNGAKKVAKIESNQRWVGNYTSDALAEYGLGVPTYPGNNRAAAWISSETLQSYVGKQVVGMRFGISAALSSSRAFMIEMIESATEVSFGDEVFSKDVAAPVIGWNTVMLDNPVTIEEGKGFFAGYDFYQNNTPDGYGYYTEDCYPLSCVDEGKKADLYIYADIPSSKGGEGAGWYNFGSDYGGLSVQLLVQGAFADYSVTPNDFGKVSSGINRDAKISISFFNDSKEAVKTLGYVVTVDGEAGEEQTATLSTSVAQGSTGQFTITVPSGAVDAEKQISVEVTKVNGNDNAAEDKVAEGVLGVSSVTYDRNMVIEEFTTEKCPNCPRVAGFLHSYLETADLSRVFAVCHHSAYYTDWLTQDCDEELCYLFNGSGSTYAPALMFNRMPEFDSQFGSFKDNVTIPGSAAEIGDIVDYLTAGLANAKLEMEVVPNADNTSVTLNISGECNKAYDKNSALLTVYMTEDNVKAKGQSGASGAYYHQHVIRGYNSTWGDAPTWNDDRFTATYTFDINSSWKQEDIKFVAFLNKHNAKNVLDNAIENSIGKSLSDAAAGVSGVQNAASTTEVARYNAAGQRIDAPQKGLNIVKLSDGRTMKVMTK